MGVRIFLGLMVLLHMSCGDSSGAKSGVQEDGIEVTVSVPAGTSWTDIDSGYLPSPANIAYHKGSPVLILSDAISEGSDLRVKPIAVAQISEDSKVQHYVIAIPSEARARSMDVTTFSDFITKYSSAKWIVEQYLLSRNGMGSATLVSWEDDTYVTKKLWDTQ